MSEDAPNALKTLLDWTCLRYPDSPRSRVKDWIREGRVVVNGEVVKSAGMRLDDPGEQLVLSGKSSADAETLQRKRIHAKLELVYLDADVAVADKEAGMLSVPRDEGDLLSVLTHIQQYLNDPSGKKRAPEAVWFPASSADFTCAPPRPVHQRSYVRCFESGKPQFFDRATACQNFVARVPRLYRRHTATGVWHLDSCPETG